jgi:protocadherin Fat 1/2/3
LQLVSGVPQLEYRCPHGFYGNLSSQHHVNDQEWHSVLLKETDTSVHLLVDSTENTSLAVPENCRGLRPDRYLLLGGLVPLHSSSNVSQGFNGCLDVVMVNGERLELLGHSKTTVGLLERQALGQCCQHSDDCSQNPCLNGGRCSQAPGAGKVGRNPNVYPRRLFKGSHVSFELTKQVPSPQLYVAGGRQLYTAQFYSLADCWALRDPI